MQELFWLIDSVRAYLDGGEEALRAVPGFWALMVLFAVLVPPTMIMIGIGDDDFGETPLGKWLGVEDREDWPPPPADLDGDGRPDFY